MIDLPVYNQKGEQVDSFSLDEQSLGGSIRFDLLKQAYVRQHANKRQGSARTKSRGMIVGSTRKLYRQKGTGNARMGASRTVIRKGGGVAFAKTKTREHYHLDMPRKMRRLANRNALLAKAVDQEIKVFDSLNFDNPRTQTVKTMLDAVGVNRTCLLALAENNTNAALSARNIEGVDTIRWDQLNTFELLNHRYLVIDREQLQKFIDGAYIKGNNHNNSNNSGNKESS